MNSTTGPAAGPATGPGAATGFSRRALLGGAGEQGHTTAFAFPEPLRSAVVARLDSRATFVHLDKTVAPRC
ncbi:hypothetical protein [Kitasatospora indigofera]|uniref:hypothetical protein n=1 Tax=Kitasatospora indigofera TaxID=67307 RepID=UPI00339E2275